MQIFENAIIRLLKKRPFYASFILNLKRLNSVSGCGVTIADGTPAMLIDMEQFQRFTDRDQELFLEHLVKHVIHLHPLRQKGRNRHDWDICADFAINSTSEELFEDALIPEDYGADPGLSAEEYYDFFVKPFSTGNLDGSGYGDGEEESKGALGEGVAKLADAKTLDNHDCWGLADSIPDILAEELIRSVTAEALKSADDDLPDDIKKVVATLLKPTAISWKNILRQFAATAGRVGKRSSWQRENRRFGNLTPGTLKKRRLNLLVAIDVSDSTKNTALREDFAAELINIAKGRNSEITVLYSGSKIQKIDKFRNVPTVVERYDGGGFTDLRPVFEYAKKMEKPPAAIIYITDGKGEAPDKMEFPTLWVLTADGVKPADWGVELRL